MSPTLSIARKSAILLSVIASVLVLAGCGQDNPQTSSSPPSSEASEPNFRMFMVDIVAPATKPIWDFGYADTVTEQDWELINKGATDLVASIMTVSTGGTSPAEQERGKTPEWQEWTKKMSDSASAAKSAVDAKDQTALATAGDMLAEICQGCHTAFDPTAR